MGLRQSLKRLSERKKLGEILLELGLITPEQLQNALEASSKESLLLGAYLISQGIVTEEGMTKALSRQFGLPAVDIRNHEFKREVVNMIPENLAKKHHMIALLFDKNTLTIAVHDPLSLVNLNSVRELSGLKLNVVISPESHIKSAINRAYHGESETKFIQLVANNLQQKSEPQKKSFASAFSPPAANDLGSDKKFSIEALLNMILERALEQKASDIHFEAQKDKVRVRQRVDGILHEVKSASLEIFPSLISRIKIMSGLDIAEKQKPQDGHFQMKIGQRDVDFRVSTLPTINGEKAVIRILDKSAQKASLVEIGMNAEIMQGVRKLLNRPHGIILVTGPTGSGKTTTVYSMIREIDSETMNVVTIEDPVEFQLDNLNQVQVNTKAGVLFSNTLRSVLRQDPDVIMVGEIRDKDTAEIAVQAALTGHLVISTLHTNDSAGTLSRLVEMGIEPFLLSSSISGIISQRLVRKLCKHCKEERTITEQERELLGSSFVPENAKVFHPKGCPKCNDIGFKGRMGIFELLLPDTTIRKLISSGQVDEPIKNYLWEQKFHTMRLDGIDLVLSGETSVDEVFKETL